MISSKSMTKNKVYLGVYLPSEKISKKVCTHLHHRPHSKKPETRALCFSPRAEPIRNDSSSVNTLPKEVLYRKRRCPPRASFFPPFSTRQFKILIEQSDSYTNRVVDARGKQAGPGHSRSSSQKR